MVRSTGILEPIPTATSNTAPKKRNWTLSEDALLTNLMQNHRRSSDKSGSKSGQTDWVGIAQHFDDRDSKDCRKRWNSSLCPLISRGSWTVAEDELLHQGMQIHMGKWAKIAKHVGSRTGDQCSSRWRVLSSGADWNEERDRILLDFVNKHGKRWAQVRRLWLPMFTNAECRNRYHRIIRQLSADKRHKTEIETLERVCNGQTLGASLSPLDKASLSNASSWQPAPALASRIISPTSTSTNTSGSRSSSSSTSNRSKGGSCGDDEPALVAAEPGRALDHARRSTNAAMESLVQQIMTDDTARDKLMQLAFTIVSCMNADNDEPPPSHAEAHDDAPQPARVEAQESEQATLADVEDSTMHDVGDAAVQGVPNAGVLDAVLDSGLGEVDEEAWADIVLGVSNYQSMSTAATQLTSVPSNPALRPTRVVEGVPLLNEAGCSRCGFKSCVCSWADLSLPDKWISTDALKVGSLNGLCGLSDTSSISGITSPTISTRLDPASPSTMRSSSDAASLDSNWWM